MSTSRIAELAQLITSQTSIVDKHFRDAGLPQPSFNVDGPVEPIWEESKDVREARNRSIEAAIELRQLLEGPMKLLLPEVSHISLSSL
jgi:hypothetical protein